MNFCLHEVNEYDLNRLDEIGVAYSTFGKLDTVNSQDIGLPS